jgi:hypothetical protein
MRWTPQHTQALQRAAHFVNTAASFVLTAAALVQLFKSKTSQPGSPPGQPTGPSRKSPYNRDGLTLKRP